MIHIVHELRHCKGTNAKLDVLVKYKNDFNWLRTLKYMYDTSINYYISAPIDYSFVDEIDVADMFENLDVLASGQYRGNVAKSLALGGSEKFGEIFRLVLGGSLKAGVSTTSINKAYPDLIPTFPLMLAEAAPIKMWPVWAFTKYDGVRLLVRVEDGVVTPKTRAGKHLEISSLIDSMKGMPNGVYDGELVKGNGLQSGRTKITGDVNRVLKGTWTDIQDYSAIFFDYLSLFEWDNKCCGRVYYERFEVLSENLSSIDISEISGRKGLVCKLAHFEVMHNQVQVDELFNKLLLLGYEGLILRYGEDFYVWERSSLLNKIKAIHSGVLKCIGTTEGRNKYVGMIGALICEGIIDGKDIRVNVSGLSDWDRDMDPDHFIGNGIDLLYNDIVKSDNNEYYSLFLPRFKRLLGRYDT